MKGFEQVIQVNAPKRSQALAPQSSEQGDTLVIEAEEATQPPRTGTARAVFVAHGMGQQIEFQALDGVVQGLLAVDRVHNKVGTAEAVHPRVILHNGKTHRRAELTLHPPGKPPQEVHVYEGYWAPLTEGEVKLKDALSFLFGAGVNGFRLGFTRSKRWLFGEMRPMPHAWWTSWILFLTLIVVGALVALNLAATVAIAALISDRPWPGRVLLGDWTWIILGYGILLGAFVVCVGMASRLKRWAARFAPNFQGDGRLGALGGTFWTLLQPFRLVAIALFPLVLLATIASVVALGILARGEGPRWTAPSTMTIYGAWLILFGVSWIVKGFLVQYVGDLAAYLSGHKLDRFAKLRSEIKAKVKAVADAAYDDRADGTFTYEKVAIVGHSLGSVIAYDTLNALLNEDGLLPAKDRRHVLSRTSGLFTYGSPLDKTAFIFRHHSQQTSIVREGLAAAVQPMILTPEVREKIPWTNIWSPADIISGPLNFYDQPGEAWVVNNVRDKRAVVPVAAHTEFDQNPELWTRLYATLTK